LSDVEEKMRKILALALLAFALAGGLTTFIASYAQAGGGSCESHHFPLDERG
jgi:hypothetical protein